MVASKHDAVVRRHLEAEAARKMDETLATLTPDCVFEDRTLGRIFRGHEGAAEYYRLWWDAFENTVSPEHRQWTTDGALVSEVRFQGMHQGRFLGLEPTGRAVDLPVVIFISFGEELMAGERLYWDVGTLLRQLGITSLPSVHDLT